MFNSTNENTGKKYFKMYNTLTCLTNKNDRYKNNADSQKCTQKDI